MTWKVEFTKASSKQVSSFDTQIQIKIRDAIRDKLSIDPEHHLKPLSGDKSGLYKFRVGDYRLLCVKDGNRLIITVIKIAHRREVYH